MDHHHWPWWSKFFCFNSACVQVYNKIGTGALCGGCGVCKNIRYLTLAMCVRYGLNVSLLFFDWAFNTHTHKRDFAVVLFF